VSSRTLTETGRFSDLETLEDLFRNAPVGFLLSDPEGVPLTYNRAYSLLTGAPWPQAPSVPALPVLLAPREDGVDVRAALAAGEAVVDLPVTVTGPNGAERTLLVNALARLRDGEVAAVRWVIRPDLRQAIPSIDDDPTEYLLPTPELVAQNDALSWAAELGADDEVGPAVEAYTDEQAARRLDELDDFIMNTPAAVHLVDIRGAVLSSNHIDTAVAGFADAPEEFLGIQVRRAYADQSVLQDLLGRWDSGLPTLNFRARLVNRQGGVAPVVIFSSSRIDGGRFLNTRDVVFLDPDPQTPPTPTRRFAWPQD
jgi:hypothetical protein